MGQKSNPNSFQKNTLKSFKCGDNSNILEYSILFKENFSISTILKFFFQKKKCLIKKCFIIVNNEKSFMTVFVSFFVLKRAGRFKLNKAKNTSISNKSILPFAQKFLNVLNKFGYLSSKRLVLQNLNKVALKQQRSFFFSSNNVLKKKLDLFKKEIYFNSGLMLICLLNTTKKTSFLISKFIAYFFKMFHRTQKINKFLFFLTKFVESINKIGLKNNFVKGLKIQIKGRFKGAPRSKIRIFSKGSVPLQTITSNIDYSLAHVQTSYGIFSIKVWVFE